MDYHGTMEDYADAKRSLLKQPGLEIAILNVNDVEHENWLCAVPDSVSPVLIGVSDNTLVKHRYCFASDVELTNSGIRFNLRSSRGEEQINLSLYGEFNIQCAQCGSGTVDPRALF